MRKVIVTGASRHIGFHVANQLLDKQYEVIILVRSTNPNVEYLKSKGAIVHKCDLFKPDTYKGLLSEVDAVFHLASINTTDMTDEARIIENTFKVTTAFIDTVVESKVPKIIYTSSVVVLGRSKNKNKLIFESDRNLKPESPYVKGKVLAEEYIDNLVETKNIDICRFYPSWVFGERNIKLTPPHKVIKDFILKGQPFYFKGGISAADVKEVAKAQITCFEKNIKKEKYVVAGENITFKEFYSQLALINKKGKPIFKVPKWIVFLAAVALKIVFRLLKKTPLVEPGYISAVLGRYSWYGSSKAVRDLNFKITPVGELLSRATKDVTIDLAQTRPFEKYSTNVSQIDHNNDILITGFPGWLGNRMVDRLILQSNENENPARKVKLLVQPQFKDIVNLPSNFEIVYGNLQDKEVLSGALQGVKTVFHLAGAIYPKKIATLYKVNYEGTKNLVDCCIVSNVRRIVSVGTDSICGRGTKKARIFTEHTPPTPYRNYGKSKYLAEKYILDKTKEGLIDGTSLRAFWFFGPFAPERQKEFVKMFSWKRQVIFGNGRNFRSITHIDNLIDAFMLAENNSNTFGKWYWIGDSKPDYTTNYIYNKIADTLSCKFNPLYIPVWFCRLLNFGDLVLSKLGILHPTLHAAGKFYFDIAGEIDAAQRDFGYKPKVSLDMAVQELKEMV